MIKNYILDTNVLVHSPGCLYQFSDNNIIIPIVVLEELDNLKNREGIVGYQAREAIRELNNVRKYGNLNSGITLPGGGSIRVELDCMSPTDVPDGILLDKNDNKILIVTKNIEAGNPEIKTILVTKDLCMAIKAESLGLEVQDYQNDKIAVDNVYKGWRELMLSSADINRIYDGGLVFKSEDIKLFPNEFLFVKSLDSSTHTAVAKFSAGRIIPLKHSTEKAWGLIPRNKEQQMAYELLMDEDIHLVTLTGGAGTGKTILSTAVALQKVIETGTYSKIVFVRPVIPAGSDIGFLPGNESEKLRPWMGSFFDAIESLTTSQNTKTKELSARDKLTRNSRTSDPKKPNFSVEDFIEQYREAGVIETKTFTYMRGRTLSNALVIIDEAQEMTPHLAKLMLTRAGQDSKFVMIGDPSDNQIDNTFIDSKSNGLVYVVEKMKEFDIAGHISLEEVERSPLAKLAEEFL